MAINIKSLSTTPPEDWDEKEGKKQKKIYLEEIERLQNILMAAKKKSLLIILQGMDAAGKDSTVRKVLAVMNPIGMNVHAFKKPTDLEMSHDFLWRIHQVVPAKGMTQVFNRSHYEDVLIQRVHHWIDEETAHKRFQHINDFEQLLTDSDTIVIKFFLHISPEAQLIKLEERTVNPEKYWKHNQNDFEERKYWEEYMQCYEDVLNECNQIPWHIIPCDNKKYKEYLVAKIVCETLEKMDLKFPSLDNK
ncbi:MAG TPA: PPK2 family polyphosphate kinase [Chitinophagales bacterium]|nr:PPK2 family polyphosphate kinase [Chitinophagales bacterium]